MAALRGRDATPGVVWNGIAWEVTPVHEGPAWVLNPDWDGVDPLHKYMLPELTLGWEILKWIRDNLWDPSGKTDAAGNRLPFRPTYEQARLILWWYAIDERGRFVYREGVLTRLKGWGKDPFAAALAVVEFVGPCRFAGWASRDMPAKGIRRGDPVGKSNPVAWIQIAAVSKDQTRNTSTLFPQIISDECKATHRIDMGKEIIYGYGGNRRIECVTSSPRALEGGRPTFVIMNETHHWLVNNEGHKMSEVIDRNATKAPDGAARVLAITNAYDPAEDSVAQQRHESYLNGFNGEADSGVMYDTLEAPPEAKLRLKSHPATGVEPTLAEMKTYLASIVDAVRGDASWLDLERIVGFILDRKNTASESRRFFFNQVVAAENAWVDALAVAASVDPLVKQARDQGADPLRAGWDIVLPDDEIVMFFDGSKSDDSTGLIGCRLSDGFIFVIGVWQKPRGDRGKNWLAPRGEVHARVVEAFARFKIVGFWADPSHAKDDENATSYWRPTIDDWHRTYKDRLDPKLWARKTGIETHSILFDMSSPANTRIFIEAAETFVDEMEHLDDIEQYEPLFAIDGHPALIDHLTNARANPYAADGKYGVSLAKENRESNRKIDLAVCAVGARLLRRLATNVDLDEKKDEFENGAEIWGLLPPGIFEDEYV